MVSVDTPLPLYRVSGLVLELPSPAQLPFPHPPISHSFKTSLLCLETNRMAKKTPPPHPWDWAGNVGQGAGFLPSVSLELLPGCCPAGINKVSL